MNKLLKMLFLVLMGALLTGCGSGNEGPGAGKKKDDSNVVIKRREDGTVSSVNPLDEEGFVHGIQVNYYEDGKTLHSKVTYVHGTKQGPALWYYKNGQVYEHTAYVRGLREGLTRKYYENGVLMEETTYSQGKELPGKKRYDRRGEPIQD
jgi:antitoxin component YwqK of YwqJK toxin-antitoxin module